MKANNNKMTHQKDSKTWLRITFFTILSLVIICYAGFQARKILEGPELKLTSPLQGTIYNDPLIEIAGIASNIKEIQLDDRTIYIDEQGNFKEKLLLFPGYNIIRLKAQDKFGKETEKKIELVYDETDSRKN